MQCSYCFWMNVWHWSKLSVYHCKQVICSWLLGEGYRPTSTSILHLSSSRLILARVTPAKCQNANLAVFGGLVTAPLRRGLHPLRLVPYRDCSEIPHIHIIILLELLQIRQYLRRDEVLPPRRWYAG